MKSRVPLRIDLAGGWSDIPPFATRYGGAVINAAITQYVAGEIMAGDSSIHVTYGMDLPSGTGLGSSAALSVAWLALVKGSGNTHIDQHQLAEDACAIAALLGIRGGKQDEYAVAVGGVNLMRFHSGVEIEPLKLSEDVARQIEDHLVLCHSGISRFSTETHTKVWRALERGERQTVTTLSGLRDVALSLVEPLQQGNMGAIADGIELNWGLQKSLDPSITTPHVDALLSRALEAGGLAGKACGAGGGGCLLIVTPPDRRIDVCAELTAAGGRVIDCRFDWTGVQLFD